MGYCILDKTSLGEEGIVFHLRDPPLTTYVGYV